MKKTTLILGLLFLTQIASSQNVGIFEENPLNTLHIGTNNNPSTSSTLQDNSLPTNVQVITPTIRIESLNRNNNSNQFESRYADISVPSSPIVTKNNAITPLRINKYGEFITAYSFEDVNRNFNNLLGDAFVRSGVYERVLVDNFSIKTKSIVHLQANVAPRNANSNSMTSTLYQFGSTKFKTYFKIENKNSTEIIISGVDEKFVDVYENNPHKRPTSLTPQMYTVLNNGNYKISLIVEHMQEDDSVSKDESIVSRQTFLFNPEHSGGFSIMKQASNFTFNIFPL